MGIKRHKPEEIVAKLRQFEVFTGRQRSITQAVRTIGGGSPQGGKAAYIEPGSPWENGYCESFNSKLRDELLNGEIFYTLLEAEVLIEGWRRHYNMLRPHSSLSYRPPAPEAVVAGGGSIVPWPSALAINSARLASPALASGQNVN